MGAALALTVARAHAAGDAPPPTTAAPADCPGDEALAAKVRARRTTEGATALRSMTFHFERVAGGVRGTVAIDAQEPRVVDGETCTDVADALATIAALALDHAPPLWVSEPAPRPPAAEPPSAPAPPAAPASEARVTSGRRWRVSVGAAAGGTSALAPSLSASFSLFVDVAAARAHVLSPSARLAGETAVSPDFGGAEVRTNVRTATAALDLCPFRLPPFAGAVTWAGCARARFGVVMATARGFEGARSVVRPTGAGGIVLRTRFAFSDRIFTEIEGEAFALATRDRLYVGAATTLYDPPALGVAARLAAGVTIW